MSIKGKLQQKSGPLQSSGNWNYFQDPLLIEMPGMEGVVFTSLDVAIFPINEIFEYPLKMKNILILVIIHVISRIKLYIDQYHEK